MSELINTLNGILAPGAPGAVPGAAGGGGAGGGGGGGVDDIQVCALTVRFVLRFALCCGSPCAVSLELTPSRFCCLAMQQQQAALLQFGPVGLQVLSPPSLSVFVLRLTLFFAWTCWPSAPDSSRSPYLRHRYVLCLPSALFALN